MTAKLNLSYAVRKKLAAKTPPVSENDIMECFANRDRTPLRDTRERHDSDPPTMWFISENDYGRRLKVCYIEKDDGVTIRSAFVPNQTEERVYAKFSQEL